MSVWGVIGTAITVLGGPLLAWWLKNWVEKQVAEAKAEERQRVEEAQARAKNQQAGDLARDQNASIDAQAKARKEWEDAHL